MPPSSTFHPFPNLPTELRLKIWYLILLSTPPTMISIYQLRFSEPNSTDHARGIDGYGFPILSFCNPWAHCYVPSSLPPSILHINHESRSLALPHYQLGLKLHTYDIRPAYFPSTCGHLKSIKRISQGGNNRNLYFNPKRDIVHHHWLQDAIIPRSSSSSITRPDTWSVPHSGIKYISFPPHTAQLFYPDLSTPFSSRYTSVSFSLLLLWLSPAHCKPDLSQTELLGVVLEKDPRHSDYESLAWRDHGMRRPADTDEWEESRVYLEERLREVLVGERNGWPEGFRGVEGRLRVSVWRGVEGFVEEVERVRDVAGVEWS